MNNEEENRFDEAAIDRIVDEAADAWRVKQDAADASAPAQSETLVPEPIEERADGARVQRTDRGGELLLGDPSDD